MLVDARPHQGRLYDELRAALEESLAILRVDLEAEQEIFAGRQWLSLPTSPDHH